MATLFSVTRGGFHAAGYDRERGEVVDTSEWRNVQPLVNQRYLSPVHAGGERGHVATDDGRMWVDGDAADSHRIRMADGVKASAPVHQSQSPDPDLNPGTSASSSNPAPNAKRKYTKRSAA